MKTKFFKCGRYRTSTIGVADDEFDPEASDFEGWVYCVQLGPMVVELTLARRRRT